MSVKTISRSQGRTSTAASAYRSGDKICDEKTGEIHDYSNRQGVESSNIVTPENAPDWANDRNKLWNHAEESEKRSNSVVAREFEVGIPHELNKNERKELINDFSHKLSNRHQVAVDYAIHEPHKLGDERNFHAHILVTTRRIDETGFTEKTRELDNRNSGEVKYWREEWANTTNEHLKNAGHEKRIDHRSNEDRGIDSEPTIHVGVTAMEIHRRGEYSERYEENQKIISLNEYRESKKTEEINNDSSEKPLIENKGSAEVLPFERIATEDNDLTEIEKSIQRYENNSGYEEVTIESSIESEGMTEIEQSIQSYEKNTKDEEMVKGKAGFNFIDNDRKINELEEKSNELKAEGENLSWADQRKLDSLTKEREYSNSDDNEIHELEKDKPEKSEKDVAYEEQGIELEQELPKEREKEIQRLKENAQDHLNKSVDTWNSDLEEIKNKKEHSPEDAQQQELLETLISQAQENKEQKKELGNSTETVEAAQSDGVEREREREITISDEKWAEMAESQAEYEKFVDLMNEQETEAESEEQELAPETVDEQETEAESEEQELAPETVDEQETGSEPEEQELAPETVDEQETEAEPEEQELAPENVDEQETVEQTEIEESIQPREVEQEQEQADELTEIEKSIQNYEAKAEAEQGQEVEAQTEVEPEEQELAPENVDEQEAVEQTEIEESIQNYEAQVEAESQADQRPESEKDSGMER